MTQCSLCLKFLAFRAHCLVHPIAISSPILCIYSNCQPLNNREQCRKWLTHIIQFSFLNNKKPSNMVVLSLPQGNTLKLSHIFSHLAVNNTPAEDGFVQRQHVWWDSQLIPHLGNSRWQKQSHKFTQYLIWSFQLYHDLLQPMKLPVVEKTISQGRERSVGRSVHHFCPDSNISTTIERIAKTFCSDINVHQLYV